jgi:Tn3 transposase DDE domain
MAVERTRPVARPPVHARITSRSTSNRTTKPTLRRQNGLQQAIQELGCLAKTRHLLAYVDDAALRRRVLVGLSRQERVHAVARAIFVGRQAPLPERGYEAQLVRASALSLAINTIVVGTRATSPRPPTTSPSRDGWSASACSHYSPLHWEHVLLVGRYSFSDPGLASACGHCMITP